MSSFDEKRKDALRKVGILSDAIKILTETLRDIALYSTDNASATQAIRALTVAREAMERELN